MLDPIRLQILLEVLARAPMTRAEQVVCQQVVDELIALSTPTMTAPVPLSRVEGLGSPAENGASTTALPRQRVAVEP